MALVGALVALVALVAAGCGRNAVANTIETVPSSSCNPLGYGGVGRPDYILVSDLPLQGPSSSHATQIAAAIKYQLERQGWKAGGYAIGYQSCDDSTAHAGKWDAGKCAQNGNAYAANDKVIGVIGTFDSGCAQIEIPVLNEAPNGSIPMLSPADTYPCLTVNLPGGCDLSEPSKYYPSGTRNYLRIAPTDNYQGAFQAEFMKKQGVTRLYLLNDQEAYGHGIATATKKAAEKVGIKVVGFEAWDPKATGYTSLFEKVKASGADAVFLGGVADQNGAQVIEDKVAVLGPNGGNVKLFAPDGFGEQTTIAQSGTAAADMFLSVAGVPLDQFKGPALDFVAGLEKGPLAGRAVDPYAVYGGQAAQVMLNAIAASNGTRADVIKKLFETRVKDGLTGSFSFDANGDPRNASGPVVGFTMYTVLSTAAAFSPSPAVVGAAGP
jgi:branched-chain amino acid transport system substrate-binding protein